ncbi:MAG: MFS transporter, partial [Acidimicrobiia bacterium]
VALTAWLTGVIAENAGLRPAPFLLGVVFVTLGLGLSLALVRETTGHVTHEVGTDVDPRGFGEVFRLGSWADRSLAATSRAGLVNNLNEGAAWGVFPLFFAASGLDLGTIGVLVAIAPAVWGVGQLFTGALSDRVGRKWLIAGGQATESLGLLLIAWGDSIGTWAVASALFGAGTAMAYPTLLAAVGDLAHPSWRGRAVGVYRLWRDLGFAIGAVIAGVVADASTLRTAIFVVAAITALSAIDVSVFLRESRPGSVTPIP